MNKYIRAVFMPIMLLAGIFTGTMCALIIAPIALCHWLKERRLITTDLENDSKFIAEYHDSLKN